MLFICRCECIMNSHHWFPIINPMIWYSITAFPMIFFRHSLLGIYVKTAGFQNVLLNGLLCKTASKCDPNKPYHHSSNTNMKETTLKQFTSVGISLFLLYYLTLMLNDLFQDKAHLKPRLNERHFIG